LVEIDRYDPRKDLDDLKEIFEDFKENMSYFDADWKRFEDVLNKRVLDLKFRNAMIVAREGEKMVGWGTYTPFSDYLGNERILIHQILVKKEDAYKKGIEEAIIKEIESYIKNTLKRDKVYYISTDKESKKVSLFMKLGMKKSPHVWHEKDL
jgi:hypothetical protein